MPRPHNPDLSVTWKHYLPATLAGAVEVTIAGPDGRPRYGSRNRLMTKLLSNWLADYQAGRPCIDPFAKD